jgi:NADPH-dependent 2,4-dienoyl-CoA reductase/sulfur reductase-like enzyme
VERGDRRRWGWAIGDCAAVPDPRGGYAPPTAQHGIRQARVAARNVAAELGIGSPRRYAYSSLGRYPAALDWTVSLPFKRDGAGRREWG